MKKALKWTAIALAVTIAICAFGAFYQYTMLLGRRDTNTIWFLSPNFNLFLALILAKRMLCCKFHASPFLKIRQIETLRPAK